MRLVTEFLPAPRVVVVAEGALVLPLVALRVHEESSAHLRAIDEEDGLFGKMRTAQLPDEEHPAARTGWAGPGPEDSPPQDHVGVGTSPGKE